VGHVPVRVHVAVAAIFDDQGRVLISQRPAHVHQGGLWEFPGGKLEPGETAVNALRREIYEELGITVQTVRPLIRIMHDYPDKAVLLDVWRVDDFTGKPAGCEGQAIEWVVVENLGDYLFPAANIPIIMAASLPDRYLITPEPGLDHYRFLGALERVLDPPLRGEEEWLRLLELLVVRGLLECFTSVKGFVFGRRLLGFERWLRLLERLLSERWLSERWLSDL
jgi:8-oxo-dGTP diphosphatase